MERRPGLSNRNRSSRAGAQSLWGLDVVGQGAWIGRLGLPDEYKGDATRAACCAGAGVRELQGFPAASLPGPRSVATC